MKLYVLIRKDLSPSQMAVQGGHALAELLLNGDKKSWDNGTLVYLGVKNQACLKNWVNRLEARDVPHSIFREPDIGNEITAISAVADPHHFKSLNLV
ncbi:hypothetical protein KAR91_82000 [Candidatus Pacearchaeota archaeon]|nr:hypothetical protein [Candidatus Pacearchaeota archaeon]